MYISLLLICIISFFLEVRSESVGCFNKFTPIISKLPIDCFTKIAGLIGNYSLVDECCDKDEVVDAMELCLKKELTLFTSERNNDSLALKKALGSIKANEFIDSVILGEETIKESASEYSKEIRNGMQLINELNKQTAKCLDVILKANVYLLGKMCEPEERLKNFFIVSEDKYIEPKVPSQLYEDIFNNCNEVIQSSRRVKEGYLDTLIKNVNYLIGIGKCNYYADNFVFMQDVDSEDYFYPNITSEGTESTSIDTYENLLIKWFNKISAEAIYPKEKLIALRDRMLETETKNPLGLSIELGRKEINYDIILKTFSVEKYNYFVVDCENLICEAYCKGCENLIWNKNQVVTHPSISLQVSCSMNICIVLIANTADKKAGSEVFFLKGNPRHRMVDKLLEEKIKNALKSFESEDSVNHKEIAAILRRVLENKEKVKIDFDLGMVFNYTQILINSTNNYTLLDMLYNGFYNGNLSFYLECNTVTCVRKSKSGETVYPLFLNDSDKTEWRRMLRGGGRGGGGGGGRGGGGSHSSSSGTHSSSSSGKSSSSSGKSSSSSSSSKSGGSSLTGGFKGFSSQSSTKSSGSSLTKTSTNSAPSHFSSTKSSGSSLTHTSYNSNTNWKPTTSWSTPKSQATSSTPVSHGNYYYTSSSYPSITNKKYYEYRTQTTYRTSASTHYYYYDYRPTYYVHYDYFPHWNHYNYYYIDNHYYYHYRAHSVNDYHRDNSTESFELDPNDWVPSYSLPTSTQNLFNQNIKMIVACSSFVCLNYVEKNHEQDRIFLDIVLRNIPFVDESRISYNDKLNFAKTIINITNSNSSDSAIKIITSFNDSHIDTPYHSFPVKRSCLRETIGFSNLFSLGKALQKLGTEPEGNYSSTLIHNKAITGHAIYRRLTEESFLPKSSILLSLGNSLNNVSSHEENDNNFDLVLYNDVIKRIKYDIVLDGSSIQTAKPVYNNEVTEFEKITRQIIMTGKYDEKDINLVSQSLRADLMNIAFLIILSLILYI